ncbi:cyclin-A1 [Megalops cyprinoides]|uniref:cyclin-A1 n=1 Tax=Megalops cyprinoides TaxID=118141 RepID=UPI001864381B|nr:cyclin-A1 [Megalops cyprinoides]
MSLGRFIPLASQSNQENFPVPSKMDASRLQLAAKPKQRTVLGVLSENEQHNRSCQGVLHSKHGSALENACPGAPMTTIPTCLSTSSFGIYVDELSEVVQPVASKMVSAEPVLLEEDIAAMQHKDFRLFLDLSSGSCMDTSMQSQPEDDPLKAQDVWAVAEYAEDIHQHLRDCEVKCRPKAGYIRKQPDITNCMRVVLVDWLVEVGEEYKLCAETLYLAVNYLDRFLSCMSVLRGKLQLVGTAAILLAAKYEEIYPPEVDEFVYITDDTYTKKQLLRMEHLFLKVLAFDMTVPTTHQFLRQYMAVESVCSKTENLALYVAELSLLEVDPFLLYVPSKVAAAAYCLANYTVNKALWPDSLYAFTGYTLVEIAPCLKDLHKLYLCADCRPQQAIREKYKASKYCSVALITPPESLPLH